jgi:type IV pilus assembly protein PilB
MLNFLNTSDRKLITLEDPIEYQLKGITQSQVSAENDYDFHAGLRAILRQDPDVIMVGEIRDLETAQTAAQSSLTGHLVLSTLHTNSAVESIPRLINMGLPAFMIAPALSVIIAQRLVRKVCACAIDKEPTVSERTQLTEIMTALQGRNIVIPPLTTIKTPKGCDICSNTGYHGQSSVVEIIEIDTEIKEMILNNESTQAILKKAQRKGFISMKEDGVIKILNGITTVSEVWRVS